MFFYMSKILWELADPANFIFFLIVVAFLALLAHWRRTGFAFLIAAIFLYGACGFGPVSALLLRPLEDRFPQPAAVKDPSGIIVLGGAIKTAISRARHTIVLSLAGSRLTKATALARRYPRAKLVFAGGSAAILGQKTPESIEARRLFLSLGVPAQQMAFDDRSRTTYENAVDARKLLHPQPGTKWLLVTSAFHMPRAVGVFRAQGFDVIPAPSDYLTRGTAADFRPYADAAEGLQNTAIGLKEWIGLAAYWLSGRSRVFLPGPSD